MPQKNQFHREQILKGIITLLILKMVSREPMHGYSLQAAISEEIRREMPQGSIYVLLKSLEKRGLIRIYETRAERDKKLYTITDAGTEFLLGHSEPLSIAREVIGGLIEYIEDLKSSPSA